MDARTHHRGTEEKARDTTLKPDEGSLCERSSFTGPGSLALFATVLASMVPAHSICEASVSHSRASFKVRIREDGSADKVFATQI